MCSGLRINDLVISPSRLDASFTWTTRSAFGKKGSVRNHKKTLKKRFYYIFDYLTRSTVVMYSACLWFRKSFKYLMTQKSVQLVQQFYYPSIFWFFFLFHSILVQTFALCWIMDNLHCFSPHTSPNLRLHYFQGWKVCSLIWNHTV